MFFELTNETLIRALLFVIVFLIVFETTKRAFKDNKAIPGVIAFAVSLIVSFFITNEQLELVFTTMGSTGILVLLGVPFIIAFFFIYRTKILPSLRKLFWIFYGVMSIVILNSSEGLTSEAKSPIIIGIIILFIALISLDSFIKKKFSEKANLKFYK